jgi:hypothetical protein
MSTSVDPEDAFMKYVRDHNLDELMQPIDPERGPIKLSDLAAPDPEPAGPRLWDLAPETVVHIAGACLTLFGIFMRQRCEWCGVVLVEYDLRRIQVPIGQEGPPPYWEPGMLVRVDRHIQAVIENPELADGEVQLPLDCCAFDPQTQVG